MTDLSYRAGQAETRPWGRWQVVQSDPGYVVKRIDVNPGARLSLQYHNHRSEHWVVVAGRGTVTIGGDTIRVDRGSHVYVPRETKHRIANDGDAPLVFVEVQFGAELREDDIVRIEDDFLRQ
ncbi:phosphomannose isomerase type II C-terminal cupin domain [Frigidibacter sp. RF13]|uniref:phosphomannose isomerase type II C-terminal cupin domain n=1 Tax=Frigidibacter sp. RF13 TaxID=2997340 RepID=UPI002272085B|nr:phosphomannose isomerase type II C-terminal cupin domain [Frigidibacter sp. RF13]MCY1126384.1 phosphomannose isomerase type II C-terminal cupin domain [Frigidibacter sp. RF13]